MFRFPVCGWRVNRFTQRLAQRLIAQEVNQWHFGMKAHIGFDADSGQSFQGFFTTFF